jgi:carboxyl-terminal processing protease
VPRKITKSGLTDPNLAEATTSASTELSAMSAACELICRGEFDTAQELIERLDKQTDPQIAQLFEIVRKYKAISQQRQSAREAAYREQLTELDKLQAKADTADANDVPGRSDVNDVNDVIDALAVIAKASEFASEDQKGQLFSHPFVKQTIQKAIDKAADFEVQGKWLDAYLNCYSWLRAIDPENKAYSDYAEQLLDKATIVVSFQDSPCETREERYQGIEKEMLVWAIEVLRVHYVKEIDYSQMADRIIRHCELLAEVMASFPQNAHNEASKNPFSPPDANQLTAWSVGLAELSSQVKQSPTGLSKDEFIDLFEKILALNTATIQLSRPALIAQCEEAALSALDPYTVMVWPRQLQEFKKTMTNEFTGIGIEISKRKGLLTVSSLLPGTPAYKAGLDADDVITAVDGVETKDMSLICAVQKITGPAGTKVTLTIQRPGEEKAKEIIITRAKITVPTLRGWKRTETGQWLYMIDEQDKIGYVRITGFSGETAPDLENVLRDLEAKDMKGLILDLRFNTGGLLTSAINVADKFIREGPIVTTRSPTHVILTYAEAHKEKTHPDYPLVILINESSASASEIVAGALGDKKYRRAVLVGARTHGKGSVQSITDYPGKDAQLKYTMAYYHLPSDQRVKSQEEMEKLGRKDWGIGPDIEIELRSDELKTMLQVQRENDVLAQADHDPNNTSLNRHAPEETVAGDPQLAVGMLIIKTKLIETEALASSANKRSVLQVNGLDKDRRRRPI